MCAVIQTHAVHSRTHNNSNTLRARASGQQTRSSVNRTVFRIVRNGSADARPFGGGGRAKRKGPDRKGLMGPNWRKRRDTWGSFRKSGWLLLLRHDDLDSLSHSLSRTHAARVHIQGVPSPPTRRETDIAFQRVDVQHYRTVFSNHFVDASRYTRERGRQVAVLPTIK